MTTAETRRMPDPTLQMAALVALEHLVNRALRLDPAARARLAALAGQVFHLHCTRPEIELFLLPQADGIALAAHCDGPVTAGLTGSGGDFARLLRAADPAAELINGPLLVRGDSKALQQLQHIAADLDLDWEAPLARLFGDVVGHQLGRSLRHLAGRALYAGRALGRQVQDFVVFESGWVVASDELQTFSADVDDLVRRSAQLEQQLQQLLQSQPRRRGCD